MTREKLQRIAESVGEREGWDFARMRDALDPMPWDYLEVARRFLRPADRVLDVGTGGGERFLALAGGFGEGVGIDIGPDMIEAAERNRHAAGVSHITFELGRAEALRFAAASFDVVLNRHSEVDVAETLRVLRPGGHFVMQQVGPRSTRNICQLFGCTPWGTHEPIEVVEAAAAPALADAFRARGAQVIAYGHYDVRYWILDVESLVFWLQAVPIPEDFALETHWQQVDQIVREFSDERGILTNEQRELLVVRKP
jgi:ubiquinone/menaquinone biosynthesis C-methylase UbiE